MHIQCNLIHYFTFSQSIPTIHNFQKFLIIKCKNTTIYNNNAPNTSPYPFSSFLSTSPSFQSSLCAYHDEGIWRTSTNEPFTLFSFCCFFWLRLFLLSSLLCVFSPPSPFPGHYFWSTSSPFCFYLCLHSNNSCRFRKLHVCWCTFFHITFIIFMRLIKYYI